MFFPGNDKFGFVVYEDRIKFWKSPHGKISITPDEKEMILEDIKMEFSKGGHLLDIDYSAEQDATLKRFIPKEDVAGVYIYRNETYGAALIMGVEVDGKLIGKTGANSYLYTELPPGKHTLVSTTANNATLEIEVEAGKLYYVWQEVKHAISFYTRSRLHLVDEPTGQAGVLETRLAVSAPE
jgi:hypothetical protein